MTDLAQIMARGIGGALDPDTFKLRRWFLDIDGYGEGYCLATTRGKALSQTWQSDPFSHLTFSQFLKIAKCRLAVKQPEPEPILVSGELVWGLGHNGQYVKLVRPNDDRVLNSHPLDVEPESYRPERYRKNKAMIAEARKQ